MNDDNYIGVDVHQATISVSVLDSAGKLLMEAILETKAETIPQFLLKSPKRSFLTKVLTGALAFCDAQEIPQTAVLVDMDPLTLL
jgi:hypothetical protein